MAAHVAIVVAIDRRADGCTAACPEQLRPVQRDHIAEHPADRSADHEASRAVLAAAIIRSVTAAIEAVVGGQLSVPRPSGRLSAVSIAMALRERRDGVGSSLTAFGVKAGYSICHKKRSVLRN